VVTTVHGKRAQATGGHIIAIPDITTAPDFLEWFGLATAETTVTLFKAVGDDFKSQKGTRYAPGDTPEANDWDGGLNRCGGGLHLGPSPRHSQNYAGAATRFVACKVEVSTIAVISDSMGGLPPDKVKVPRVLECVEVDIDGNPLVP
jgi:hypothetical protein